ncbi:hypothetical protein [Acinetobacter sp.]|uniref:hypothetical protein n=1 Tax=Acinetobacter sp. TaxID=472 RepID=UPI003D017847
MKNFIKYILVCFSLVGCMSNQVMAYSYTGEEINNKFKNLQVITIPFEYEDGRISDKNANIYKIKKNECVIVAILNNESNFGGYEDVIYFKKNKMHSGYTRTFFSIFLDKEATKKSTKVKYDELLDDSETKNELHDDFEKYLKKMNKNTRAQCG